MCATLTQTLFLVDGVKKNGKTHTHTRSYKYTIKSISIIAVTQSTNKNMLLHG